MTIWNTIWDLFNMVLVLALGYFWKHTVIEKDIQISALKATAREAQRQANDRNIMCEMWVGICSNPDCRVSRTFAILYGRKVLWFCDVCNTRNEIITVNNV